ncbi:MAG TPA: metallophosphoesterase [Ignavibacteria bacterium]|nr:metallophosphoesterase [Ignavibacteria bacterium]
MYKIAHISDLHISYSDENGNGKKLVELLKDISGRNCDHLVITGDLVENPETKDLVFVKEILSHFDFTDELRLSIVPGNHDIFGGAKKGLDEGLFFSSVCKNIDFKENTENFIDIFKESFPEQETFPYLKLINNIAIIGINSVGEWSADDNPEGSNGIIKSEDMLKMKKILSSEELKGKYILVLLHHHLYKEKLREDLPKHSLWLKTISYKMKLHDRKKILELFKKYKVNLVLHGHTHISEVYNVNGISVVNSSASAAPLTDDQVRKYNIINLPGESDTEKVIEIETIVLK